MRLGEFPRVNPGLSFFGHFGPQIRNVRDTSYADPPTRFCLYRPLATDTDNCFAQESLNGIVRLKIKCSGLLSLSSAK